MKQPIKTQEKVKKDTKMKTKNKKHEKPSWNVECLRVEHK